MKLLIKNIILLLNPDLSISQRGLLVTILLSKDISPQKTLAKVKTEIKLTDHKEDLIYLHEKGYIEWSGYKSAKKKQEVEKPKPEIIEVVDFMNKLWGRKYTYLSKTISGVKARLFEDKRSVEDCKNVIANRYVEWKDDSVMHKNLNPVTVFRPSNFDRYLEEVNRTKKGTSFVVAKNTNLDHGQEITYEIAQDLVDQDLYNIKIYSTDDNGLRRGNGAVAKRYGKDIKASLKIQENQVKHGSKREFVYIYIER